MPPEPSSSVAIPVLRAVSAVELARRNHLAELIVSSFDQLRVPLLRYLSSFGLRLQDREEVLQEVFLSLFQHLDRGKSRANLRAWLFRVSHNLALKKRARSGGTCEARAEAELAIDPAPNPEDQAMNQQTQERLLAVVNALPEQDRRCLFLRAEGLRYREIAEILNISLGSVSISLARSLARIARSADLVNL
jgi:RNA polymerase sigma-70 factor, ECF subfamily